MWSKLTVGQYQDLYIIITDQSYEHELDRQISLLSCLFGKPVEYYEAMRFTDLQKEIERTGFLHTEPIPVRYVPKYLKVGRMMYKPVYDFRHLAAGQFIDAVTCVKDISEQVPNMHRMLAAICRPVKRGVFGNRMGEYGDIPFAQVAESMKQVPVIQANSIAVFFWNVWQTFLDGTPDFLESLTTTKKRKKSLILDSLNVGDG